MDATSEAARSRERIVERRDILIPPSTGKRSTEFALATRSVLGPFTETRVPNECCSPPPRAVYAP
jgi:hypothetical protein